MPSPHTILGRMCLGLLLAGVVYPVIGPAQTVNTAPTPTPTEPETTEPTPAAQPETPPPPQPGTPFGAAPGTFPGLTPAPSPATPAKPTTPFGAAPGTFPGISPAPSSTTPAQPTTPFGPAPGTFPGLSPAPPPTKPVLPGVPAELPPGTAPGAAPAPTAAPAQQPMNPFPNTALVPDAFPAPQLNPGYGYGIPAPPIPGAGPLEPGAPPAPLNYTTLAPIAPGALPVQAGNLRAPPVLINSSLSLSEGYTDNPRSTPQTFSDLITRIAPSTNISVDSARFQGQLTSSLDYSKFARASDQDALNENLLGFGLATIVRDHLYLDGRAAITQASTTGGVGFATTPLIPTSQQTQVLTTSLSPVWRESFGDLIDAELRYNYALSLFNNGTLLNGTTPTPTAATGIGSLSNTAQNDVTLTFATGRAFNLLGSKLTLDATKVDTQSAARSSQLRAYDDLEYAINSTVSALGRIGYEDVRYPLQPAATTVGPMWLVGGRVNPYPGDYVVLRYGKQDGIYGVSGALRYQVTARTDVLASLQNGLSSSQQDIVSNLNTSQLDANGVLVNQYTGLPSALTNPEFAYASNSIFRSKSANLAVETVLDRDTYRVFGFYDRRASLGAPLPSTVSPAAGTDNALGVSFTWSRSLTPELSSNVTLGYARETAGKQNTLTADGSLNYTISDTLTGVLHYQFVNVSSNSTTASISSYHRNLIEVGVTKSF